MSTDNPRFPHALTLTRVTVVPSEDDPFVEGVDSDPFAEQVSGNGRRNANDSGSSSETLYEGECRSYRNVTTKTRDGVLVSDYVIAMPRVDFAILPGDKVSVVANNRTMTGVVVDSQTTNLGTNVWWNQKEN